MLLLSMSQQLIVYATVVYEPTVLHDMAVCFSQTCTQKAVFHGQNRAEGV